MDLIDLDIKELGVVDIYLSKKLLNMLGVVDVLDEEVEQACKNHTDELYSLISNNYIYFNQVYKTIRAKHLERNTLSFIKTHIIFISMVLAIVRDLSIIDRATSTIPRYKLYNSFLYQIKLFLTVFSDTTEINIDGEREFFTTIKRLCDNGLLHRHDIRTNKKTEVFYSVTLIKTTQYSGFTFSYHKYMVFISNNIPYICGLSVYSIKQLVKANPNSNTDSKIDLNGIGVLNKTKIRIDKNLLDIAIELFNKYHNCSYDGVIKNIQKLLEEYRVVLDENKSGVHEIDHRVDNLDLSNDDDIILKQVRKNFNERVQMVKSNKGVESAITQSLSIELEKLNFLKFCKIADIIGDRFFYIPHHSDFRGRMYSSSQLSPILHKYIRYIISYGSYSSEDIDNLEVKMMKTRAFTILSPLFYKLDKIKLLNKRPLIMVTVLFLLIELSKKYKTNLMDKKTFSIDLERLVDFGLEVYLNNNSVFTEFEEELEYEKTRYHIKELARNNIYVDFIITKDSTASVLQHLFKWLDVSGVEALRICNIDGIDTWSDPYSYIIDDFLKNNKHLVDGNLVEFLTRKYLKKVIMTYHYSVTYKSAMDYFIESVCEEKQNLDKNKVRSLKIIFKLFFNYLKNSSEKLFYKYSCKLILDLPNTLVIGTEIINLEYFKTENKRLFIRHQKHRDSITLKSTTLEEDIPSTTRAKIPNIIHNSDSVFARKIIAHTPMYVIHDEFLVPAYKMCEVIDYINEIFPTYLENENYTNIIDKGALNNAYNIFIII